jgi:hypothetical protein
MILNATVNKSSVRSRQSSVRAIIEKSSVRSRQFSTSDY